MIYELLRNVVGRRQRQRTKVEKSLFGEEIEEHDGDVATSLENRTQIERIGPFGCDDFEDPDF